MLVYGDAARQERPADKIAALREELALAAGGGIAAHGRLVAALIEAGELAQGLADAEFLARGGMDDAGPGSAAATRLAAALARKALLSWRSGFAPDPDRGEIDGALAALARISLPDEVSVRQPEGFAHYGVYPELYGEAAAALAGGGPVGVIGIRSIGTALAACVAAALRADDPWTVRPVGHPFRRRLSLGPGLDGAIRRAAAAGRRFAVVDEGPGFSGSSFGAVAAALAERGVPPERLHLFPSHANPPGPQADESVRALFSRAPRHLVDPGTALGADAPAPHRLSGWVEDVLGEPVSRLQDISGGGWRRLRYESEADWPPAHPWAERRKFLARTANGAWLVKFAGLGRLGQARLARARLLAEAGFAPAPAGWRHGFLVERWHGAARGLDQQVPADGTLPPRGALLERIGTYLGFRARHLPAPGRGGASLIELHEMAEFNTGEALGPDAAARLARRRVRLDGARPVPVETDSRLQPWEWLVEGGRLLKSDALDHHGGHDLVGCQDIAWDVAGATVEFALDDPERRRLAAVVGQEAGRAVDRDLVEALLPCYAAFQLGSWTLAGQAAGGPEAERIARLMARYRAALGASLSTNS